MQGSFEGFIEEVLTPSGELTTKMHVVIEGTGLSNSNNQYVFHQTNNTILHDSLPLSDTMSVLLISKGSEENFATNLTFQVTGNGEFAVLHSSAPTCRG